MPPDSLEIFKATVGHQPHAGFLFYADFTPDLAQRVKNEFQIGEKEPIREKLGMFNPRHVALTPPETLVEPDFTPYYEDVEMPEKAFINHLGVLEVPGSMYHFTHYVSPLRNAVKLEDIESFPFPQVAGFTETGMAAKVKQAHGQGRVAFSWVGHMYESSWQIRGYQQFLMDMVLNPEWCEFILDKITETNLTTACAAARSGVDIIQTGDDVANQNSLMFSPGQWRKFIKPRWAKVYAAAKKIKPDLKVWYHSDGNIEAIIPELIEIGVDILNPVQPECLDPVIIKKKFGNQLVLDGTIGTQTTMPFGTPDDVRTMVLQRAETLDRDGALILSPTHILEPEVPLENIKAFIETAKRL